ncbi:MAG: twin-arginine translocase subunit TatC [Caldimicrobium sp.]
MTKLNLPKFFEYEILTKIRKELIKYLIFLFASWFTIFFLFPKIFPYLLFPYFHLLHEKSLVFISLEEALFVVLRASFYLALSLTLPILIIRLFRAISGELYEYEKNLLKKIFFISIFLAILGIIFGYFFLTPFFLKIFLYFGKNFENNLRLSAFLFFFLKVILFSIIIFQIPLIFALFIKENIITEDLYKRKKLYFLGGFYFLSLLFSPTDFFSQILLTLTFYLFFKISFLIARFLR